MSESKVFEIDSAGIVRAYYEYDDGRLEIETQELDEFFVTFASGYVLKLERDGRGIEWELYVPNASRTLWRSSAEGHGQITLASLQQVGIDISTAVVTNPAGLNYTTLDDIYANLPYVGLGSDDPDDGPYHSDHETTWVGQEVDTEQPDYAEYESWGQDYFITADGQIVAATEVNDTVIVDGVSYVEASNDLYIASDGTAIREFDDDDGDRILATGRFELRNGAIFEIDDDTGAEYQAYTLYGSFADLAATKQLVQKSTDRDNGIEVHGDDLDDLLVGLDGDDYLYSGAGDDLVIAGAGDDIIVGGAGLGDDLYDGGDGRDTITYNSATAGLRIDLFHGVANSGDATQDAQIGRDKLVSIENIVAGDFDDLVIGNELNNDIAAEGGDDVLIDGWGRDQLDGGVGCDVIHAFEGGDTVIGGAGDDTIYGGRGDDIIQGGSGDDLLYGDTFVFAARGSDRIIAGSGNDRMQGGYGSDTFVFYAGDVGQNRIERIESGAADFQVGIDIIELSDFSDSLSQHNILDHIQDTATGAEFVYGDMSVVITGVSLAELAMTDFIFT